MYAYTDEFNTLPVYFSTTDPSRIPIAKYSSFLCSNTVNADMCIFYSEFSLILKLESSPKQFLNLSALLTISVSLCNFDVITIDFARKKNSQVEA